MNKISVLKPTFRCIYCGKEFELNNKTIDHIPSRSLFPKGKSFTNPITVPSCHECNKSFSQDEEYFRIFLVNQTIETSFAASELFHNKVADSIRRRPQIGHKVMQNLQLVNLFTEGGLFLGVKTAMYIPKTDWARHYHVLDKYARGIYYHRTGKRLEDLGFLIKHKYIPNLGVLDQSLFRILTPYLDNQTIFACGSSFVPSTGQGIIIMTFFERVNFMTYIATEQNFKDFEAKSKQKGANDSINK